MNNSSAASARASTRAGHEQRWKMVAEGMRNSKGLQSISVNGISPKTHFATVMVEADYRMKLIGIGLRETRP